MTTTEHTAHSPETAQTPQLWDICPNCRDGMLFAFLQAISDAECDLCHHVVPLADLAPPVVADHIFSPLKITHPSRHEDETSPHDDTNPPEDEKASSQP